MIYLWFVLGIVYNLLCAFETSSVSANENENNSKTKHHLYKDIENKINTIKQKCGTLCEIDSSSYEPLLEDSKFFYRAIKKDVDCKDLWNSSIFDESSNFKQAIQKLPVYLQQHFSYNNMVDIKPHYYDERYDNIWNHTLNTWAWSKDGIEMHEKWLDRNVLTGTYGVEVMKRMKHLLEQYIPIENKHVLVIGSILPWIEVLLLSLNVGHITTLEYDPYPCTHPNISTFSPIEFSDLVLANEAPMFDGMVTFSSIEHSGLGRYGDQLNPWGDIIAMGRAWCQMKPGSRALVGVPTAKDTICFNAARLYGSVLYQHLFANWKQIYSEGDPNILKKEVNCRISHNYQPMHVLEK